jgi:hypothetical protein
MVLEFDDIEELVFDRIMDVHVLSNDRGDFEIHVRVGSGVNIVLLLFFSSSSSASSSESPSEDEETCDHDCKRIAKGQR